MNKLVKTVKPTDLYREFLMSLNGVLLLTDRELDIMLVLIDIQRKNIKFPNADSNIINSENRRYVRTQTGITNDNLSRYLGKLKRKGLIIKGKYDDEWVINPALIPDVIGDRVQITIILKINDI